MVSSMGSEEPMNRSWKIGRQQAIVLSLLIIPVVAMAVAILFPIFARARARAQQLYCMSNVKDISLSLRHYADDHDGQLPASDSWQEAVTPYMSEVLECPATGQVYIFNESLARKSLADIANPAQVPAAWDAPDKRGRPPHGGGFNIVFLDGHVRWVTEAEFRELMRDVDKDAEMP